MIYPTGKLLSLSYLLTAHLFSLWSTILVPQQKEINEDLNKINYWTFQWKMNFNSDPSQQAQEVLFSRKLQKVLHPAKSVTSFCRHFAKKFSKRS